ncbi:MAG TPA: patatin-like phospholipase family protein [Bryobacteraceae bacterium]|nr:patatin-like phospholipase family protein [Bryobacteraceae bacterium]
MAQKFLSYLYWLRVPLLTLVFLGALLPLSFQTALFRGLADLTLREVKWASFMALLIAGSAMATANLVFLYAKARMLDQPLSPPTTPYPRWGVWVFLAGHLPYIVFLRSLWNYAAAQPEHVQLAGFSLYSFWGWLMAIGAILALTLLQLWFATPSFEQPGPFLILPLDSIPAVRGWLSRLHKARSPWAAARGANLPARWTARGAQKLLGKGYYSGGAMLPGHAFALFMLLLSLCIYVFGGLSAARELKAVRFSHWLPTLFWVLLGASLVCWLLAGAAFFWDRFRVPLLTAVAVYLIGVAYLPMGQADRDFFFETSPAKTPADSFPTPPWVMDQARFHNRAIVVAAAGGGIQAAAWTAQVLAGLQRNVDGFDSSVAAISAVSGGSVGTLFYLQTLPAFPGAAKVDPVSGAEASSLEAVAWGLVQPDLARTLLPGFLRPWKRLDRGWALEQSFAQHALLQNVTLADLALGVKSGLPAVIFNSTQVESGRPLVFTNSRFPNRGQPAKPLDNFKDLTPGRDVKIETAARMSASFPYVSPNARPASSEAIYHLADGGYYDNYGITSLDEWIREAAPAGRRLLVIRIVAFPQNSPAPAKPENWFYQFISPLLTIYNARGQGQILRDEAESSAFQSELRYSPHVDFDNVEFRFSSGDPTCNATPPLSWHLSQNEKSCIQKAWSEQTAALNRVKRFLGQP